MNKKIIGVVFLFISLVSFLSLRFLFLKKDIVNTLPEVKLKPIIEKEKAMAIMISNDGSNYQEYTEDTWPGENYRLKEAKCIDNNGSLVDENIITFENDIVTLETNQTVYCTLYFDKKTIIEKLRENDPNKVLSSAEVGGMYRYQGVGVSSTVDATHKLVDNNYICFGTNDASKCNCNTEENCDKYMYRIIGVTKDNQLYLIKMKGVEENGVQLFTWNDTYKVAPNFDITCPEGKCPEWPNSLLFKRLNGISKGTISGAGTIKDKGNTDIFINNKNYNYMKDGNEWYNKIEKHKWLYGNVAADVSSTSLNNEKVYGNQNNGLIIYDIETGVKPTQTYDYLSKKIIRYQWSKEKNVEAKIGLMYLHDYYLAYDNERNWRDNYDTNNWLLFINNHNTIVESYEWLIAVDKWDEYNGAFGIKSTGRVISYIFDKSYIVRPTFYLSNSIQISGKGTIDNPYIINF